MSTPTKDARPPRLCPYCLAGTPAEATTCWLCQSQLPPYEQRPASDAGLTPHVAGDAGFAPRTAGGGRTPGPKVEVDFVFWVLATVVASLLLVVLVFDVGYLGGLGYAAIATVAVAPVLAALGAMVWLRRPVREPEGTVRGESKEPTPMAQVLGGVALTVTSVLAVVALIALLVLALLVLAFVACLIAIGAPGA